MTKREMAKALGGRGGRARAKRLTTEERGYIASLGGHARRESLQAARRLRVILRYARIVALMRGSEHTVRRMKTFAGPLPGLYRHKGSRG